MGFLAFMKANWIMVLIGGLVFVGAGVGVVIGVLTRGGWADRGLMKTRGGKPLKWALESFPLTIWLHPDLPAVYVRAYNVARMYINKHAGRKLLDFGTLAPSNFQYELLGEGHVAIAMAEDVGSEYPNHGSTVLTTIDKTGRIMSGVVTVPSGREALASPIMLHECFHLLGFDHDEQTSSLMHPRLQARPQEITKKDLALLRKVGT